MTGLRSALWLPLFDGTRRLAARSDALRGIAHPHRRLVGEAVCHRGVHYTIDGIQFLPRPAQQPGVPVWIAGFPGSIRPLRRAARYDGFFPVNLSGPDQLAEITTLIAGHRQHTAPYDIAVGLPPGTDPAPYAEAGATWWLTEFEPDVRIDQVRGVLRNGPAQLTEQVEDRHVGE
jgi:alkanesulfonate monooxygenase SsuD/methylene tetrahydromethanopterin reductase-like flavin-dependent oxidoreductase (luciferase family)